MKDIFLHSPYFISIIFLEREVYNIGDGVYSGGWWCKYLRNSWCKSQHFVGVREF